MPPPSAAPLKAGCPHPALPPPIRSKPCYAGGVEANSPGCEATPGHPCVMSHQPRQGLQRPSKPPRTRIHPPKATQWDEPTSLRPAPRSPNGASQASPGHHPGERVPHRIQSPERASQSPEPQPSHVVYPLVADEVTRLWIKGVASPQSLWNLGSGNWQLPLKAACPHAAQSQSLPTLPHVADEVTRRRTNQLPTQTQNSPCRFPSNLLSSPHGTD